MSQQNLGSPQTNRPGQMTAVMRAMPQVTGPKVLRIGVVQGGKVIEERVIKQRTHVTIGPSEKSMFVLPTKSLPPNFKLFELVGSDYALNFLDGMSGRVALKTGVSDLAGLKGQARRVPIPNTNPPLQAYQISLSEEARGKVMVGETTFLFQFVAPPPIQPKPQLPVSVKSGFGTEIDWTTTIIAAFSFLFHFGAIGFIYTDWDPVVDDEVDVQQLLDSVKQLPPPPPVEQKNESDVPVSTAAAAVADAPKASTGGSKGAGSAGKGSGKGGLTDARASAISNELASLDVQMLGALNSSGNSTASVLSSGDVPTGLLNGAANSSAGVGRGGIAGLNMGSGAGGAVRPGTAGGGGLASIGNTGAGSNAGATGSAQAVKRPVGNANVGGAAVSGGSVANASAVVAGMAAGFRRCYNKGLAEDPNMKGSVRITAKIGPNGEVLGASPSGGGGLSGTVISCVTARVSSAQFSPPEGGGATVVIPVTFVSQ
jgi:hypothetical protein